MPDVESPKETPAMEEAEQSAPALHKKKRRHRKKQLYASILKQMEFYFSDAALSKDRFLSQMVGRDPFVPLEVFLNFNKIKSLTNKCSDIANALRDSKMLQISEDLQKVKRVTPLVQYDTDARTVYVESIPPAAGLAWITEVFQAYGPVAYVSLPKYYNTNRIKGFAFVEFQKDEDAESCVRAFSLMGCKMPTTIRAETLSSCQGFQPEVTDNQTTETADCPQIDEGVNVQPEILAAAVEEDKDIQEPPAKKPRRKRNSSSGGGSMAKSKREDSAGKVQPVENVETESEEVKADAPQESAAEQSEGASEVEAEVTAPGDKQEKKSKPLRKKSKKDKKKAVKEREKKSLEGAAQGLQVLPKREWKVLRNKYLTLQRKNMKALKQVLRTQHAPDTREPQMMDNPLDFELSAEMEEVESVPPPPLPPISFVAGVIVHGRLAEPCVDVKQLKNATKANVHVKFVDVKEGQFDVHVRLDDADAAKQLAASGVFPSAKVLEGEEEKLYWEELQRQQQSGRPSSRRKMRGRVRLVKKAEDLAPLMMHSTTATKHIRFDD